MMTRTELETFLTRRGWSAWYHPDYWVHPDAVTDPTTMNYTNYGMRPEHAYEWEQDGRPRTMFGTPKRRRA